ncbi:hypothetical protein QOZ83_01585 [Romboutsia sedimentorum]|uniref:hypothetical protein n=1 Tax=Romboutsia sedimentorum TaxID=1368474 RepID=UPI0024DECBC1|nr:hypothetical protein [Romboutsia sedimentorum]MDK2584539.1 hypothetical protein [Romboutsia sedimentorum]
MSIKIKRCIFSIMLICAIFMSFMLKSEKGFEISIMIVLTPLALAFVLDLMQTASKSEVSNAYGDLTPSEKLGSIINIFLICIWVIGQLYCLI